VFLPRKGTSSETFIRAHVERLRLDTVPVYGGGWRRADENGPFWPALRYAGWTLGRIVPAAGRALYARALARKLRLGRFDVALAEYGTTGAEIHDACRAAGVPLVVYFFGFDASSRPVVDKYLPEYRRMFGNAAAIVAVSDSIAQRLLQWGAPAAKLRHIVCGADSERFSGAAPEQAPAHFLAVGRMTDKKAPHLTVLAFRDVAAVVPTAKLSMVGDGPLLEATRRVAASAGLERSVAFLGVRTPEEVATLMRGARAFVQHSVTAEDGDSEGTPVALLEAQMAGLPVVSTRHAGIREVVAEGETGLLVEEGDAAAMGRAMVRLAQDPALAATLGRKARERAMQRFSLERSLSELAAVLEEAARGGPSWSQRPP
jgi:glycosyltransferase involved in cell wall biosynthesis